MRTPITVGTKVTFNPRALPLYQAIHGADKDTVYTVAHIEERRGEKHVFYLAAKGRIGWIPAYRRALTLERRSAAR